VQGDGRSVILPVFQDRVQWNAVLKEAVVQDALSNGCVSKFDLVLSVELLIQTLSKV